MPRDIPTTNCKRCKQPAECNALGFCKPCWEFLLEEERSCKCSESQENCPNRITRLKISEDKQPDPEPSYCPQPLPGMAEVAQPIQGQLWADVR